MTKPKITKLLAVAVLAAASPALASRDKPSSQQQQQAKPIKPRALPNGRPACGNTMGKGGQSKCDPDTAITTAPAPMVAARQLAPAARRILAIFGITDTTRGTAAARPRELKNGRAANGNIPSRSAGAAEEPI